jgi:hypothetical protein
MTLQFKNEKAAQEWAAKAGIKLATANGVPVEQAPAPAPAFKPIAARAHARAETWAHKALMAIAKALFAIIVFAVCFVFYLVRPLIVPALGAFLFFAGAYAILHGGL